MAGPTGVRRLLWLYRRSLGANLRAVLEYETDFWIMVAAALAAQLVGLVFIGALFSQVPELHGWRFAEVVLIYALANLAAGIGALLFDGVWRLPWMVNQGELDYLLVRPYPVVLQVTGTAVGMQSLGEIVGAGAMLGWALWRVDLDWSPITVAVGVVLVASAVAIRVAVTVVSNAAVFWLTAPSSMLAVSVNQLGDLARYPLTVYGVVLRVLLAGVLPFAFTSFFPAAWLVGRDGYAWVGLLTPVVALYCVGVAALVFRRGLRRYESAGH
ncbi:ABC transporter permease [Micromonospora sp. CPCC 206061]|uniref:ABC transporter permease n=1 Tax=Micromonospora sp. CPCC 206061 TaxID=3122410 RepID=UPI002FF1542D